MLALTLLLLVISIRVVQYVAMSGAVGALTLRWQPHRTPGSRRGLGSRLLAALKEIAWDEKCDQVHLDTGYQRHAAHKAYLRAGFHLNCHHLALPLENGSS